MIMMMVTSMLLLISEGRGGRRRAGEGAGGVSSSSLCSADYCHLDCDNFDEQENYDHYGHYHYKGNEKTFVNVLNVFCSTIVAASAIDVSGALTASHCCLEKTFVISFVLFKNI